MIPFALYPDFPQFDPGDRVNGIRVTALRGRISTMQSQSDRANPILAHWDSTKWDNLTMWDSHCFVFLICHVVVLVVILCNPTGPASGWLGHLAPHGWSSTPQGSLMHAARRVPRIQMGGNQGSGKKESSCCPPYMLIGTYVLMIGWFHQLSCLMASLFASQTVWENIMQIHF